MTRIADCPANHSLGGKSHDKMNPAERDAWCVALLSGDYQQATGVLRCDTEDGLGYCCWGVYCDLKDPNGWADRQTVVDPHFENLGYRFQGRNAELPSDDFLRRTTGIVRGLTAVMTFLAVCNDGDDADCEGHTFPEIAEWIKTNL